MRRVLLPLIGISILMAAWTLAVGFHRTSLLPGPGKVLLGIVELLNIVGGFVHPTGGEIRIDGEPVRAPDPRRIFVFQERGVFPWLTVERNIGFGLRSLPAAEHPFNWSGSAAG